MEEPILDDVTAAEPAAIGSSGQGVLRTSVGQAAMTQGLDILGVEMVSQLTGRAGVSRTDERWNIAGTDIGFSFLHNGRIHMVFGDTWGRGGVEGDDWRSNTMAVVEPHPEHGFVVVDAVTGEDGEAIELLHSLKQPGTEYTVIPHSGVSIDGRMYLHYMSIRDWEPQEWGYQHPAPNGSGFAWSDDDGYGWTKDELAYQSGDNPFTHSAMVEDGEFVYMFGTPAGRFGAARLMRVPRDSILQPDRHRYWTGAEWRDDVNAAIEVVPAPVGELSVRWSDHHQRWLMMYLNDIDHTIVLRTAERLEGPWSDEQVVVSARQYPTLYAPMMLPHDGPDIMFAMSIFEPDYQVYIMRMTLGNLS